MFEGKLRQLIFEKTAPNDVEILGDEKPEHDILILYKCNKIIK